MWKRKTAGQKAHSRLGRRVIGSDSGRGRGRSIRIIRVAFSFASSALEGWDSEDPDNTPGYAPTTPDAWTKCWHRNDLSVARRNLVWPPLPRTFGRSSRVSVPSATLPRRSSNSRRSFPPSPNGPRRRTDNPRTGSRRTLFPGFSTRPCRFRSSSKLKIQFRISRISVRYVDYFPGSFERETNVSLGYASQEFRCNVSKHKKDVTSIETIRFSSLIDGSRLRKFYNRTRGRYRDIPRDPNSLEKEITLIRRPLDCGCRNVLADLAALNILAALAHWRTPHSTKSAMPFLATMLRTLFTLVTLPSVNVTFLGSQYLAAITPAKQLIPPPSSSILAFRQICRFFNR